MVEAPDIDFVISKIQDGIKTGAHGPIPPGQAKWLAPAHVVLTAGKRRLVVNHRDLNDSCEAASCKYENIDDLVGLLSPKSYMLSADLVAAYHHVPTGSPVTGAFIDLNEQKRHKLTAAQIAKRSCERKLS